jgi:peptidoglycan hydrolase CwlO-like protein
VEEVEERMRRQSLPRGVQELQSEIEEGNRKVLELSRTVNQTRLERDSLEDEMRILKKKMTELSKLSQEW